MASNDGCPCCGYVTGHVTSQAMQVIVIQLGAATTTAYNGYGDDYHDRYRTTRLFDEIREDMANLAELGRQFHASRPWVQDQWPRPPARLIYRRAARYQACIRRRPRPVPSLRQRTRTKRRYDRQRIRKAAGL